jgi:hypothetical protein
LSEIETEIIQLGSWSFNKIRLEDMDLFSEYIKNTTCPSNLWSSNLLIFGLQGVRKERIYCGKLLTVCWWFLHIL